MYRESDLQTCLFSLVGFRQNDNPDYPVLPASLVQSDSGLYFQDEHPLLSIENIDQALKNYDKFNYSPYVALTVYATGTKVRATVDGKVYESIQDANQGNEPSISPLFWTEVPLLAQKLEALHKAAINKIVSRVFIDKKLSAATKSIFENVQLFDGAGSMLNKEIKNGRFVGFEIRLKDHRDLTVIIRRLGTQFTQVNPAFKLYLFHSSQITPIQIFTKVLTKANSFEWSAIQVDSQDFVLRYLSDDYLPGGSFYLGYYEDDLVGQAINKGYDFGVAPRCTDCNRDYKYWSSWSQFIDVQPIEVSSANLAGIKPADLGGTPELWDIRQNGYQYVKNFGLNFDLSVRCDVTDFFCRERTLFTDAILKQVCVDLLNELAYSTRNNVLSKETRELAMYELNNKANNTPGAAARLEKSLKGLQFDTSDLNEACLPCDEKFGANWTTI